MSTERYSAYDAILVASSNIKVLLKQAKQGLLFDAIARDNAEVIGELERILEDLEGRRKYYLQHGKPMGVDDVGGGE